MTQAAGRPERRRSRRVPLEAVVQYQIDGQQFIHLSSDISADGIFIRNYAPPPVGTELSIEVRLPPELGGHPIELSGRVVRVAESEAEADRGMGVAFTALRACSAEAIRFFVKEIYEVDHLERLRAAEDLERACGPDGGRFEFSPAEDEVLPLRAEPDAAAPPDGRARLFADRRSLLLWGGLLVLVGAVLGGGLIWVFLGPG